MRRIAALLALAAAAGCQQKMAEQPYYRPYEPSRFFPDGMSARKPPEGAVAREWLLSDDPLVSGLKPQFRVAHPAAVGEKPASKGDEKGTEKGAKGQPARPPADAPSDPAKFVDGYPFELTRADVERGQERYTIFCAVCHDPLGNGNGKIPERGYVKPPNFHADGSRGFALYRKNVPLRTAPVGYLFEVVSRGYGAMPRYGPQIPPRDRWRIVAYVRALQLSQHAELNALPPGARKDAEQSLGGAP
jgi:mono/diheme cytochrome c family protein